VSEITLIEMSEEIRDAFGWAYRAELQGLKGTANLLELVAFNKEARQWCDEHLDRWSVSPNGRVYFFESREQAVRFKLWLS
jgi:hypothetical protein